ncbi:MAG: RnfABCDGE type electron transport complex subunit D [Maricaulaceae bacterium]
MLAGILAVGSKYILKWNGKHIFNPANFGLVILSLTFSAAWISPGQWGTAPIFALFLLGIGGVVTGKAKRWDVSLALLGSYGTLLFARAIWLNDPFTIPLHQLQNGALLIFAFFMISDPKTTPDSRTGRIFYACTVATIGFTIQFGFYNSAGIILALILTAPFVPAFDKLFPSARYHWPTFSTPKSGVSHETIPTPAE